MMTFIVNAIAAILGFFLKKEAFKVLTLPIKIAIYTFLGLAITAYISAFVLFFNFIFKVINMFYTYLNNFNSFNVGSGSAYGLSLSTIWTMFVGFMSASGLGTAFYVASNLFLTLLFGYLAVKITLKVSEAVKEVAKILSSSSSLVG